MNEPDLTRRLSISIVDALKAEGRILVVAGRPAALARELEAKMAADIAAVAPRIQRRTHLDGEVTSTFGDETADERIEDLVARLTTTLMDSDHVEDVFADDNIIQRDIFRVLHDGLLDSAVEQEDEAAAVLVRLDALGYVASTVGKRAPEPALHEALTRAARAAGGALTSYDRETREATFSISADDPDARLELEEAVADELTDLVDTNVVTLPTFVRRIDLGRAIDPVLHTALRGRIEAAAERTLLRSGCAASWELTDERTVKAMITPLSEQDALDVDHQVGLFAQEIAGQLGSWRALRPEAPEPHDEDEAPAPKKAPAKKAPAKKAAATETATKKTPAKKTPAKKAAATETATKKAAAKKAPAKKAAATETATKKTATKKAATKKAPAKKAATKKPAAKR